MVKLTKNTISDNDIDSLCEFLKQTPRRLTMGSKVKEFEESFAKLIGTKYAVMVNSGSSANLLMLAALIERGISKFNKKVVVPALSWATDLAPVMQLGLEPILCDCNLDDLSVDLVQLEKIFKKEAPSALLLVSVLGLVPDMGKINELCDKYHVVLLEDNCESLMSEYKYQRLGSFGTMSSFSFYHAHHISTIEGGCITTNQENMYELLLMLRSHGWDRDISDESKKEFRLQYDVKSDFDSLYKFYISGFNVRPTEIQAFLGLQQLNKVHELANHRQDNYNHWMELLPNNFWKPNILQDRYNFISSFAIPVIQPSKQKIIKLCEKYEVECRPLIAGSLSNQPFFYKRYGRKPMCNAEYVDLCGLYLPNHHGVTLLDIEKYVNIIKESVQ